MIISTSPSVLWFLWSVHVAVSFYKACRIYKSDDIWTCLSFTGYIAGFVEPEVVNRPELFDVYVNLPDSVIKVSQNAKGTLYI